MALREYPPSSDKVNPFILLFLGFFTGGIAGLIIAPSILPLEEVYGEFRVNWETLLAGMMGLIGGACAFIATRWERNQRVKNATFRLYELSRILLPPLINQMQRDLEALSKGERDPSMIDKELIGYLDRSLPEVSNDLPLAIVQAHSRLIAFKTNISTPLSITQEDTEIHRKVLLDALPLGIISAVQFQSELNRYGAKIKVEQSTP
ncbi:hypothetical protein [Thalassospira lucentensis]|uniref:hypothetical protein n=1 Tax=Thalassospira lucentensis TaxID=168935 RepID=UPI00399D6FAF